MKPKAFVVLRPDSNTEGLYEVLKEHVKQKIGPWKYPRWIDVVDLIAEDGDGKDPAIQVAGWCIISHVVIPGARLARHHVNVRHNDFADQLASRILSGMTE